MKRQLQITGADIGDEELENLLDQGNAQIFNESTRLVSGEDLDELFGHLGWVLVNQKECLQRWGRYCLESQ